MGNRACCRKPDFSSMPEEDGPAPEGQGGQQSYDQLSQGEEVKPVASKGGKCSCGCCGCSCFFLLVLLLWGVVPFVLNLIASGQIEKLNKLVWEYTTEGLTPETIPEYIWWPGCTGVGKNEKNFTECAPPCYSPELIPAVGKLARDLPWKNVSYPSRKDESGKTYELTGWWLPGDTTNLPEGVKSPRVVIQHGYTSNSNKWWPSLAAYYMRSLGFSVLLNNIRDHGYSQNTSLGITTWGCCYHYDMLGAWDYLKNDPDGIFGGNSTKVGLMGGSMGAFITLNAFTLEAGATAAWADSPPASPQEVLWYGAAQQMPAMAVLLKVPGIKELTWFWMHNINSPGVDITARTPLKDIPTAPGKDRPVQLVMNLPDKTVPQSGVREIEKLINQNADKYIMTSPMYTDATCNKESHLVTPLLQPAAYREKLCDFWTAALDVPKSICGLGSLQDFNVTRRLVSAEESHETLMTV